MPTIAIGPPTAASSKKPSPGRPWEISRPSVTRFVEVPISVQRPPIIEAKERGMSSFEGATWYWPAQARTSGMPIATSAVLLRKAEAPALVVTSLRMAARSRDVAPSRWAAAVSSAPVSRSPAAMTKSAPSVSRVGLANPASARSMSSTPARTSTPSVVSSTMSGLRNSRTSATNAAPISARVRTASPLTSGP